MLEEGKLKQLHEFIGSYSHEELIWINGYLAGVVSNKKTGGTIENGSQTKTVKKISLVYGTETGNAKRFSSQLAAVAKKHGVNTKLVDLSQYRFTDLVKEEYFIVVISTQGEGEPPIPAKKFYDELLATQLSLPALKYSVLALGDSSYPMFCKTGEDVDAQLEKAGAKRIVPLQKCDVDFEDDGASWFEKVLAAVNAANTNKPGNVSAPAIPKKSTGKKYYAGKLINNINLNDRGSNKSTYHIEIGTEEAIDYEPGDTIGIIPRNREDVVEKILVLTGIDPKKEIATGKVTSSVRELLLQYLNICYLLTSTIKKYATIIQQEIPDTRMDLVDLLRIYPVKDAVQFEEVIKVLMPIAPRLYSIASSPSAHGLNEVHITVARDRFLAQDEQRYGLCSEFLGDQPVNSTLTFYVHKDRRFKLPSPEKNIVMIGPGTGIAPFRAFLGERDASGAEGKNWLFFGEQHFTTDFLYQTEIQNFVHTGVLNKVDLAFSRDQSHKIYVQDRMKNKAAELFQWINEGASVYISGTKDPMAVEVENTLVDIIAEQGNKTPEESRKYLDQLAKENRYAKDVY
jgi:sulfite reductase (NADPH) flavoprotein alpha-component